MQKFKDFIKTNWISLIVCILLLVVSFLFFRECTRNLDIDVQSKGNKVIHNYYVKPPKNK